MDRNRSLAQAFLSHVSPARASEVRALPDLEGTLGSLLTAARTEWPEIQVESRRFMAYLAERLPTDGNEEAEPALLRLAANDLYLACASAQGDPRALEAFDRRYFPKLGRVVGRLRSTGSFVDEVLQILRQKLFIGDEEAPPKITEYAGHGSLDNWLRIVATRTGLSQLRKHKRDPVELDERGERARAPDPALDLEYMKARYRGDFEEAFQSAFTTLTRQDRRVLRMHFLESKSVQDIGAAYGVHRFTVHRWVTRARQKLLEETRRLLAEKLDVQPAESASIIRMVQSQLDVSIHSALKTYGQAD